MGPSGGYSRGCLTLASQPLLPLFPTPFASICFPAFDFESLNLYLVVVSIIVVVVISFSCAAFCRLPGTHAILVVSAGEVSRRSLEFQVVLLRLS